MTAKTNEKMETEEDSVEMNIKHNELTQSEDSKTNEDENGNEIMTKTDDTIEKIEREE